MNHPTVETELKQILIKNSALRIRSIGADDSLTEDLGFDSLAFLLTLSDLEDRFRVAFPVEKVKDLRSLRFKDLVNFVHRELARSEVGA